MDWMGQLLGLPDAFLHERSGGKGGGCIQGSARWARLLLDCALLLLLVSGVSYAEWCGRLRRQLRPGQCQVGTSYASATPPP